MNIVRLIVIAAMAAALLVGCSSARTGGAVRTYTSRDMTLPVDAAGTGTRSSVAVARPASGLASPDATRPPAPGLLGALSVYLYATPDAQVSLSDATMWYDADTAYRYGDEDPVPFADAMAAGHVVWWVGPKNGVSYHLEDGVFVLDEVRSEWTH